MLFKEERGQTAIEVLLILSAAVIIAAVVAIYLKSIPRHVAPELHQLRHEVITNLETL